MLVVVLVYRLVVNYKLMVFNENKRLCCWNVLIGPRRGRFVGLTSHWTPGNESSCCVVRQIAINNIPQRTLPEHACASDYLYVLKGLNVCVIVCVFGRPAICVNSLLIKAVDFMSKRRG